MNALESLVYNILKSNPEFKRKIRNIYQDTLDILYNGKNESSYNIEVREGFYFGFHDKSPWSPDNTLLLSNQIAIPLRMPQKNDEITIGYFQGSNFKEFIPIYKTRAFNYQQGCMLQWVSQQNNFIFNDFDGVKHISKVYSKAGELLNVYDIPVGSLSSDGNWAVGHCFERVNFYYPGYGYANGTDPELLSKKPINHGISSLNLQTGKIQMIFSVKDIANFQPDYYELKEANHFLTHCLFSPSSKRFVFFHRWIKDNNILFTRMISSDINGNNLYVFPTDGMVSHVGWYDEDHVLAYCRVGGKDRYVLFKDGEGALEIIGEESFNSDGHPSFSPNKKWLLTDTYPDRYRNSYLALYDLNQKKRYNIAKLRQNKQFSSPDFFSNWQADFHPRWDRTGQKVSFDSSHTGIRSLCTIDLGISFLNNDGIKTI